MTATCERTGRKISLIEGFFVADSSTGEWSFVSIDAPEMHNDYSIPVDDIVKSPEEWVDWIAHLNEKTWFDAKKFLDFFTRFRSANKMSAGP